jgi:hypothetical protein
MRHHLAEHRPLTEPRRNSLDQLIPSEPGDEVDRKVDEMLASTDSRPVPPVSAFIEDAERRRIKSIQDYSKPDPSAPHKHAADPTASKRLTPPSTSPSAENLHHTPEANATVVTTVPIRRFSKTSTPSDHARVSDLKAKFTLPKIDTSPGSARSILVRCFASGASIDRVFHSCFHFSSWYAPLRHTQASVHPPAKALSVALADLVCAISHNILLSVH